MNKTLDRGLWRTLESFDIDGGPAALTFEARLARENRWPRQFAARVVQEYKKFLYLTQVAGHMVTPSEEVDQAWHLHMVYTRSYWERLCGEVLKKPLHHEPTKGGAKEGAKFEDLYEKTKESYRRLFGEEPPADIWPRRDERFGEAEHFQRVNVNRFWMIPRPRWSRKKIGATAAIAGAAAALAGCVATRGVGKSDGTLLVIGLIAVMVVAALIGKITGKNGRSGSGCGSGCGGWFGGSADGSSHGDGGHGGDGGSGCGSSGCSSGCGGSGCGGGGCGGGGCSS